MRVAILGATSQIAKDLIIPLSKRLNLTLFCRNTGVVEKWLYSINLSSEIHVKTYRSFNNHEKYDVIINFVGIGDPAKTKIIGNDIFNITEKYDDIALNYIKTNKSTKYIFISSGSVYGGNYCEPVNENSCSKINVNNITSTEWYAIAKLYAEAKHRSLYDLNIVDIRIFNYFSYTVDLSSEFLISHIVRSIKTGAKLLTSSENIVRDYIGRKDFFTMISLIVNQSETNSVVDLYSRSPVDKLTLLSEMKKMFGLKYEFVNSTVGINATGSKVNYFSENRRAESFRYTPSLSSIDMIVSETNKILKNTHL